MMSHASALGSSAPLARGLGAAPPRGRATRSSPRGAEVSLASGRTPTASTSRVSPRDPHRVGGVPSRAASARPSPFVAARRPAVALRAAAASPAPSPAPGDASASGSSDTGETTAIVNTVKAIFGAGGFSLPWAYAQGGTVLVTACLACSCVFGLASLKMLVKAQETLVEAKVVPDRAAVQTYAGLTGAALGPSGDALCKVLNVVTCFGISVGYIIFVADTLISMLPAAKQAAFSTARMIVLSAPLWVALAWQRSLKGVDLIALMGTASVTLGMIWVTIVALTSGPLQTAAIPLANASAFPGFFGTVAFLFFIHFTLFPIQEGMRRPEYFVSAVSKAFYLSALVAVGFGLVGAFGFGPGVKSVVITMLPGAAGVAVKALLCVNLLFTFPLMARSCLVICEGALGASDSAPKSLAIRAAFVLSAAALACVVPNFGTVLGYVGGFCCCAMTLAMPPVILSESMKKAGRPAEGAERAKIAAVCAVGLVCMALSVLL
jgi:proton-coupled amino acid transporter